MFTGGEDFSDAPTPPDDLVVDTGSGVVDVGAPTYDLDHDGTPETAVVESDNRIVQVTDVDGDGHADRMLAVDRDTHEAAILVDNGAGDWQVVATGHLDYAGDFVPDEQGTATPVDHPTDQPDIVYQAADGTETDLGAPSQDLDGDGVNESVAVRTGDGSLLIFSDADHDGSPDQLIKVDPSTGAAVWAVPDGNGGWTVVQTGHVDESGSLVVDEQGSNQSTFGQSVTVPVGGTSFEAGPATIDSDGDGTPDTVEMPGPDGSHIFYRDTDGDGIADRAWTTDADGRVSADYQLSAEGTWEPAADNGGSGR